MGYCPPSIILTGDKYPTGAKCKLQHVLIYCYTFITFVTCSMIHTSCRHNINTPNFNKNCLRVLGEKKNIPFAVRTSSDSATSCRFLITRKLVVNMEEREALKREIEVLQGNVFIKFARNPEICILIPYVDQMQVSTLLPWELSCWH